MLRIRRTRREKVIEGARGVTLTSAESGFFGATSLGGGGFSYHRPVLVRNPGTGVMIPIRDHVMIVRLAAVAALLMALIWRWIDGK
jgi:hypothetical protein